MTTIFWKNGVNGDFGTASNWSTDTVPGGSDDAVINAPGTYTVTSLTSRSIAGLTVGLGVTFDVKAGFFSAGDRRQPRREHRARRPILRRAGFHEQIDSGTGTLITYVPPIGSPIP
jgi:hypothetical protein